MPEGTTITLTPNTTGIAKKVTITVKGVSTEGIKSYTLPTGTAKTYSNTPRTISETYEVTANGTYTFKITDSKNNEITESITITNVLAGTIQMSANKTTPTKDDVIVTITWPTNTGNGPKQLKVGEGAWQTVTGKTSQVTVKGNCTVRAKVSNSIGEMIGASITIDNIDRNAPIVLPTTQTITIDYGANNDIKGYFTALSNGLGQITNKVYTDISDGNLEIENTNTLSIGTHIIKCTATKETGAIASATIIIVIEPLVFGNLYKISDTEYHLIFNGTGNIAQGYTEAQLVARGTNIKDGAGYVTNSEGVNISDQPWEPYSGNITKVKIEEEIKPRSIAHYFRGLTQITEIEGFDYLNMSNVANMWSTFYGCSNLQKLDVTNWNIEKVTNMQTMFYGCKSLANLDVSKWNTENVTNMRALFYHCSNLTNLDVSNWNTESVTDMCSMFNGCSGLTNLDLSGFNTGKVKDMSYMFYGCSSLKNLDVNNWNTGNVTSMHAMFLGCSGLTSIDVSNWNTEKVTDMCSMFNDCTSLLSLDVSGFNTGKVTDMGSMFDSCTSLTVLDVSKWNVENVTDMIYIFAYCSNLTNLDVSKWNTKSVTSMHWMFYKCNNLTSLDVSKWNTENVIDMQAIFYECSKLTTIDVTSWNTKNVTDMRAMFHACSGLTSLDLSSFNTRKVKDMSYMFQKCTSLKTIYASDGWSTNAVTAGDYTFNGCTAVKGAISFSPSKLSSEYANWTAGYLTYKSNT